MRQASRALIVTTPGQGLHDITRDVVAWVATGLLTLFVRHTSCSLLVQ